MERTSHGTRAKNDRPVFRSSECMRPIPSVQNKFVLRRIVESSDDRLRLHPHEELGYLESGIDHSITKRPYHLVGVEYVRRILTGKEWCNCFEPFAVECSILFVRLEVVIRDLFIFGECRESAL